MTGRIIILPQAIMDANDRGDLPISICNTEEERGEAGSPVKESRWSQREALPGEPRCVICGRYGEYICDETDDDVCSMECKKHLLENLSTKLPPRQIPTEILPAQDECIYVRDHPSSRIDIKGESKPASCLLYSSFNLPPKLQENLNSVGYEVPTEVQRKVIPAALSRKNLLVSSETGSGKTASFLIPVVSLCSELRMRNPEPEKKPLALILEPTRELCVQVEDQAKLLGKGLPFKTALIIGGEPLPSQIHRLKQGIELIIGTPGRLIDLLTKNPNFELDEISILVLDEVDCMLQKGFIQQVMQLFHALSQPQVLMFSATVTPNVEKTATLMARDLVHISVGKSSKPSENVTQLAIWVEAKHKKKKLFDILKSEQHFKPPAVVFVESRLGADFLSEAITTVTKVEASSIHGEKSMKERREIIRALLAGEVSVVVSTGVLGRGVDLWAVRQVIIFDLPSSIEEYVHLVGRASRRGEKGSAIVLVSEEDKKMFNDLGQALSSSGAIVPPQMGNSRYLAELQKKRKAGSR